jgi:hypothetical protein
MIDIPKTHTIKEYKYNLRVMKILHWMVNVSYAGLIGCFIFALLKNANVKYGIVGILFIGIIDYFGYRILLREKKKNDQLEKHIEETWGNGAVAEFMVQDDLENLPEDCRFIPDFPKEIGGNVDFIIICAKGIFVLEVKSNEGVINYSNNRLYSFNWQLRDDGGIEQTMKNAMYISDLLEKKFKKRYFVQGVLEYPRGEIDLKTIHKKIDYIWIGGQRFHEYAIKKSKSTLSSEEISNIFNYLNALKNQSKES